MRFDAARSKRIRVGCAARRRATPRAPVLAPPASPTPPNAAHDAVRGARDLARGDVRARDAQGHQAPQEDAAQEGMCVRARAGGKRGSAARGGGGRGVREGFGGARAGKPLAAARRGRAGPCPSPARSDAPPLPPSAPLGAVVFGARARVLGERARPGMRTRTCGRPRLRHSANGRALGGARRRASTAPPLGLRACACGRPPRREALRSTAGHCAAHLLALRARDAGSGGGAPRRGASCDELRDMC